MENSLSTVLLVHIHPCLFCLTLSCSACISLYYNGSVTVTLGTSSETKAIYSFMRRRRTSAIHVWCSRGVNTDTFQEVYLGRFFPLSVHSRSILHHLTSRERTLTGLLTWWTPHWTENTKHYTTCSSDIKSAMRCISFHHRPKSVFILRYSAMSIRVMCLLKRKEGMSLEEFSEYWWAFCVLTQWCFIATDTNKNVWRSNNHGKLFSSMASVQNNLVRYSQVHY